MSSVTFRTLLDKIQRASHDYSQIQKQSSKLLQLIADKVTKDLDAPAGTVVIKKVVPEDDSASQDEIPESKTEYLVELQILHATLCTTFKGRRNSATVQFDELHESGWKANLHEVDLGSGTTTSNAINDLSAIIISKLNEQADKFRPC